MDKFNTDLFDSPRVNVGYNSEVGVKIDRKGSSVLIEPILANQGITVGGGNSYNEIAPPAVWIPTPRLARRRRRINIEDPIDRAPWVGLTQGFFDASYTEPISYSPLPPEFFGAVDRRCFEPDVEETPSYFTTYSSDLGSGSYSTYTEADPLTQIFTFRLGLGRYIGDTAIAGGDFLSVYLTSAFETEVLFVDGERWDGDPLSQDARHDRGLGILGVPVGEGIYARGLYSGIDAYSDSLDQAYSGRSYLAGELNALILINSVPGQPSCSYRVELYTEDIFDPDFLENKVDITYDLPIRTNIQSWLSGQSVAIYRRVTSGAVTYALSGTVISKYEDPEVSDLERSSPFFFPNPQNRNSLFPFVFSDQVPLRVEVYDDYETTVTINPGEAEFFEAKDLIAVNDGENYSDGLEINSIGKHLYTGSGIGTFPLPSTGDTLTVSLSDGDTQLAAFPVYRDLQGKLVRSMRLDPVNGTITPNAFFNQFPPDFVRAVDFATAIPSCPTFQAAGPFGGSGVTYETPYTWSPSEFQNFGITPAGTTETRYEHNRDYSSNKILSADWVIVSRTGFRQKFRALNSSLQLLDENSFPPTVTDMAPVGITLNGETLTLEATSTGTAITWDACVGFISEMQEDYIVYAANSFTLEHLDPFFTQLYVGDATLIKDKGLFLERPFGALPPDQGNTQ